MSIDTVWTCACGQDNGGHRSLCQNCYRGRDERPDVAEPPAAPDPQASVAASPAPAPAARNVFGLDWRVAAAIGLAVAVVFGALAIHSSRQDDRATEAARALKAADADASNRSTRQAEFDRVVAELSRYVAQARGLEFKQPVRVEVLEDGAFASRLAEGGSIDRTRIDGQLATFKALGLIDKDFTADDAEADGGGSVVGFYDHRSKELFVRGFGLSPYVKFVLVHELTHALQDQHFDLTRLEQVSDDAGLGARSVVEGDAERIARGYVSTLGSFEQDIVQREAGRVGDDLYAPGEFYLSFVSFPYVVGKHFTTALVAAGGQPALDGAFRELPTSSEQIIHPDRYPHDRPETVGRPPAGGAVVDEGTIGEFELIVILGQVLDGQAAFEVGSMWGGSRYVTWTGGGKYCTRLRLVPEGPGASELTARALSEWAAASPGATALGTELTSCR